MQGMRQGGVMSTDLFKLHLNNLLHQLPISDLAFYIGHLYIGSATCADDMSIITGGWTQNAGHARHL